MSLFKTYSDTEIARITTEYAPAGKIFNKKRDENSNLFKYFKGVSKEQIKVIDTLNTIFDGLFPKNDTSLLDYHEADLGIPDNIFSGQGSTADRQRDVVVKKYMMRGNRIQDFIDIANIYGVSVTIQTGLQVAIFPLVFPIVFSSDAAAERHTLYITLSTDSNFIFPLPFPLQFAAESNVSKVKKIYNHIKPATTRIIYL
ncbi:MAG: hypothetical protein OQL19_18320 [Gammaproteobacteria bacterium]|nr:hypothetical protein [Gammaproteobacteria bacterium]